MSYMEDWLGRQIKSIEVVEQWPLRGLASLIDEHSGKKAVDDSGATHACSHWLYFVPSVLQSDIDVDGHPKRGEFIPPFPQARRMWAKSAITYHQDMNMGDRVEKVATIAGINKKSGKSGELIFLDIDNQYLREGALLREERQTIVYRDHQPYDDSIFSLRAEEKPDWSSKVCLGSIELFRYSAITFNGHKIHYDSDYTRDVEGYPAIIVQGQFIATLVLSRALAAAGVQRCKRYSFKAVKPVFSGQAFIIEGCRKENGQIAAWARQEDGRINMLAEIEI